MTRHDLLALFALLACVGVFFGPALVGDRAVFTWNMDLWQPWRAAASPDDLARPTRLADCARQFAVMRSLATDALADGRIPLWNRWIYSGTPFLANFQPGVFYPPNLVLAFSGLPIPDQMTAYLAFHLLIAAAGTFVLLRSFRLGTGAALLGALVFGWSGFNAARTGIPTMVATGAWLPWALAASRRWFEREDGRSWAGMAAALGMSGLAGFAQVFVFTAYAWAGFGLIEGFSRRPRRRPRRWIGWVTAGAVGVLLVSVHLVPALELRGLAQDATNSADMLASGTLHPWILGKLVVPDLFGHPVDGTNATHFLKVGSGFYHQTERSTAVYVGILPLLLAAVVLLAPGDHRREATAGLLLAGLGLLYCFATPLTNLAPHVPGLGFSRPDRATFLWCFGVAVIAGIGADRLAGPEGPSLRRSSNRLALVVGAAALLFSIAMTTFPGLLPQEVVGHVGRATIVSAALLGAAAVAIATGIVGLRAAGRLGGGAFLAAAIGLIAADLGWFAGRLDVMQPKESIFRRATSGGVIEFLQRRAEIEPSRILRYEPRPSQFEGLLPPSTAAPYGIEDALGFDSMNLAAYQELMTAIDPAIVVKRGNFRGVRRAESLTSPLVDLLNVRWILAETPDPRPGLETAHVSEIAILENRNALPRAFLVPEIRVIADPRERLAAMADPSFRPDLWAYAEGSIEGLPAGGGGDGSGDAGTARIVRYEDERVTVEVAAERPSLLVLTDAHYPGWKAFTGGAERPIHRVDHAFRGVVVEPGDREVDFRYEPGSFRIGAALSLVALGVLGLGAFGLGRSRPGRGHPEETDSA